VLDRITPVQLLLLILIPVGLSGQRQEASDSVDWQIDLDDVVVTAAYAPTASRGAVHQVRVIDREDMVRFQARNLQQLLTLDASIRIQEDRFLGSRTSLLGIGGQNVKVLIDGVPVIGRLDGNIDLGQIHLDNIEQVEIVEGPLSVTYGTDALAGVINIITRKSQLEKISIGADAAWEERGERASSLQIGYRPDKQWFINVHGGMDRFPGWDVDTTRSSLWKPKFQDHASGLIRFIPNTSHDLKYQFNWLDETILNEGDIRRAQFRPYAIDERYNTRRNDHSIHYHGNYNGGWHLSSFVAYNRFDRTVDAWRLDMETGEELSIPANQDTSMIQSWNARGTLSRPIPGARFQYMLGVDLRYDDSKGNRIAGGDTLNTYMLDQAVFGSLRFSPFPALDLETGLRYAYNNRYNTPLIPSFNVRYALNELWTLRAAYGKGFRAPDIKELFFNFIDVNHFIVGNQDLTPESSDNLQLGLSYYQRRNGQELSLEVKTFYNAIRDKIELFEFVSTADGMVPAIDTVTNNYTYFNLERFRTKGLVLRASIGKESWHLKGSYQLTGQIDPGLSERFGQENRYIYNNELSFDLRYRLPWIATELNLLVRYYDRLVRFYPAEDEDGNSFLGRRVQDGFTNVDLMLGKVFWTGRIRLNLGVRNLFDIQQRSLTGELNGMHTAQSIAIPVSPGRRFFASMAVRFAR